MVCQISEMPRYVIPAPFFHYTWDFGEKVESNDVGLNLRKKKISIKEKPLFFS